MAKINVPRHFGHLASISLDLQQQEQQHQHHQDSDGAHLAPVTARVLCLRVLNHKSPTPRPLTWPEDDAGNYYHYYAEVYDDVWGVRSNSI